MGCHFFFSEEAFHITTIGIFRVLYFGIFRVLY